MRDRFARAKKFIHKNRYPLVFTAGAVFGVAGAHRMMSNDVVPFLTAHPNQLQQLIDEPGGALKWMTNDGMTIYVLNEANPNL